MDDKLFVSRLDGYSATRNSDARLSDYNIFKPRLSRTTIHKTKTSRKRRKNQDFTNPENNSNALKSSDVLASKVNCGRRSSATSFKTMVNLFLQRSSVYALNQVGNSATARRKVFWMFILIVGVIGCVAQVGQFFTAYFKYPVVTNRDSIRARHQEFPAVTVCNLNTVRKEYLPCLEKESNSDLCLFHTYEVKPRNPDNISEPLCKEAPLYFSNSTLTEVSWTRKIMSLNFESKLEYGHQGKDFIRNCKFNGYNCTYANFVSSVSHVTGNCYIFNFVHDQNKLYASSAGPHTGLELELDLEVDKYTKYTDSVGARVEIHNPYLDHDIDDNGINISPGYKTFIGLSKYASERLPPPYKDHCREYAVNDSQKLCYRRCVNNIILSLCSCTVIVKNTNSDFKTCDWNNVNFVCCYFQKVRQVNLDICDCPLPCHETLYHMRISHAEWPSKAHYDADKFSFLQGTGSSVIKPLEEVRKTRLRLKVFFDTMDYTVYKQNPMYQSSEVLSQVGSQMGLWLGLSLVAIFECIENFIALCKYKMKGR